MKYKTKPVIIEATQFKAGSPEPKGMHLWPDENGATPRDMSWGYCDTRQGRVHVQADDWIITLSDGESYPCKPDVFENKYEPITEEGGSMDNQPLEVKTEDIHEFRRQIDGLIQAAKRMLDTRPEKGGREVALVHTKLQEAKMWAGKILEELGSELPEQFRDKA